MTITIHRGSRQIGGCVTEYAAVGTKLFIDLGANLPGNDAPLPTIDGLTDGNGENSALFVSHTHGDHIGALTCALPNIPVYMGETAKEIELIKTRKLVAANMQQAGYLAMIESAAVFEMGKPVRVGGFTVTPLWIDHSAFDAYMFVIEADGVRVLHTGDFRMHGPRGGKLMKVLSIYARSIDYIVCEGTLLSREGKPPITERELGAIAKEQIHGKKYIFAVCSSTNIDRIAEFYHANHADDKYRRFVVDKYQKEVLDVITARHGKRTDFYKFDYAVTRNPSHSHIQHDELEENGFFALIRGNGAAFETDLLSRFFDPSSSLLIYSMWDGYLKPGTTEANERHIALYEKYQPHTILHTSGHASRADIRNLCETVNPRKGTIPIHTDAPETFREIVPGGNTILLNDGEVFEL